MKAEILAVVLLSALQGMKAPPTLRVVTLETLVANYAEYDGHEIVVAGIVLSGEGSLMDLPVPTPPGEAQAMFVTMSVSLAKNPGPLERQYLKLSREQGGAIAILRGRFEGRDKRAFGHLGCCRFKLEITKVLSVGEITALGSQPLQP